jgi:hypothetical protein
VEKKMEKEGEEQEITIQQIREFRRMRELKK